MEYQGGGHNKKMLLVWVAAVKRMEAAEKLARQRFAAKCLLWNLKIVQKENKMAIR